MSLPLSKQIFSFSLSAFYCFLYKSRLFSLGDSLSASSLHLSASSLFPRLSLGSLFLSFPLWLALLCISYAGFEAICVCDYYQTRPEEKVEG